MRMYPKKLRNIEELKKEKQLLLQEKKQLEEEKIFTVDSILSSAAGSDKNSEGGGSIIEGLAPVIASYGGPVMGLLTDIVKQRFAGSKNECATGGGHIASVLETPLKQGKNILKSAAKELIGGYLKWKAIELSYKGITLIVKKQKKKKAERAAQAETAGKV